MRDIIIMIIAFDSRYLLPLAALNKYITLADLSDKYYFKELIYTCFSYLITH